MEPARWLRLHQTPPRRSLGNQGVSPIPESAANRICESLMLYSARTNSSGLRPSLRGGLSDPPKGGIKMRVARVLSSILLFLGLFLAMPALAGVPRLIIVEHYGDCC
jgi:hypothetical protein